MRILNEINDKETYYKINEIIESNVDKKVLFVYRYAQREIGSMYRPPSFNHHNYSCYESELKPNFSNIINGAIAENFDMIIFYRPDLNLEDFEELKSYNGIEIVATIINR